ncbi:MAG: membrane protein insertion efficiency factor YidD [Candidatus Omnitrophota bacterium]
MICFLIRIYQTVSHLFLPKVCRFYPSCSQYSLEAIKKYGTWKGLKVSVFRILKCSPLSRGGYDPVR